MDGSHRLRMLKRLVDSATSATGCSCEVDLYLEVLLILLCEEQEIVRQVLSMMREVAGFANVNSGSSLASVMCQRRRDHAYSWIEKS